MRGLLDHKRVILNNYCYKMTPHLSIDTLITHCYPISLPIPRLFNLISLWQDYFYKNRIYARTWDIDENKIMVFLFQNSYYYLLRRYLESVYPGCEAKSTFLKLIQKILELRKLAEEVTGVYLDVNPIEPLLMEIFDLKHHAAWCCFGEDGFLDCARGLCCFHAW